MPRGINIVTYRLHGLLEAEPGERIAVTTSTGRTVVDAKKLVSLPAVKKLIRKMAESRPRKKSEAADPAS